MEQLLKKHRELYAQRDKFTDERPYTTYYLDEYIEHIDDSVFMREALATLKYYENCKIRVWPSELVVGAIASIEPVGFHIGSGTFINSFAADEYIQKNHLDSAQREELNRKLDQVREHKFYPIWEEKFYDYHNGFYTEEEINAINTGAASTTFFGGHLVPDFSTMVNKGLGYYENMLQEKIHENPENDFYGALAITLKAFQTFILRTAEECKRQAEKTADLKERENMLGLSEDLVIISSQKPQTFRQALQLVWFGHFCNNADSFGRFDTYMEPFYQRDLQAGRLTQEDALAILKSLMIKIDEVDSIQNMTIGGKLPNGENSYTEFTELVLKAVREMGFKGPNLCVRVNEEMPDNFWTEISENLATGQGIPALYHEEIMLDWLREIGIEEEDALDFCLAGCSQVMIPGKSQFVNDIGMINAVKILELTLYNGIDSAMTGVEFSYRTGDAAQFKTFEELLEAYEKQLSYYAALEAKVNNKVVQMLGQTEGYNFRSIFTQGCIETGKGVFLGGAKYNHIELECIGLTNAADSLAAIKKAVFEDKIVSMQEILDAMKTNFENAEELRGYLLHKVPKFGNDDDYVDAIRARITNHFYEELRKQKGILGGMYIPGEVIFIAHDGQGAITGATPDGRKKATVLADSAGAMQGLDQNGPTALMKSVLKIPVNHVCTSVVLNIKFLKSLWDQSRDKAVALFRAYFKAGGQQIQVNVCDQEVLKKAYERPEDFPNLVVRVGGYSAYFHTLSKELQLEIINRTSY